jgi:hypothetical protein
LAYPKNDAQYFDQFAGMQQRPTEIIDEFYNLLHRGDRTTLFDRLILRRTINRTGRKDMIMSNLLEAASELNAEREHDARSAYMERQKKQTKLSIKGLIAALLLIGAASTASAQYLPYYGCSSLRERGYYGTPTGGGPQYDYGGGDQYGYGPGYSYARQAPPCNSRGTSWVGQRGRIAHEK